MRRSDRRVASPQASRRKGVGDRVVAPTPADAAWLDVLQLAAIAGKEFRDRLRNRWVLAVAAIFAAFATLIAYFGAAGSGVVGVQSIDATIASLVSLVIYLVPLIALVLGFDAIVGERERGSLDLLLSMPITRFELLIGKYLGLAAALAASTTVGFGLAGIVVVGEAGAGALFHYAGFVVSSVLLGMTFLALALLVSVLARDRARASGVAIGVWFLFVLVFDLAMLGVLVASGGAGGDIWAWLLLLNPADVFRVLNVFSTEELRAFYGLATVFPPAAANPFLLTTVMLAWIAAPLAIATWRFR